MRDWAISDPDRDKLRAAWYQGDVPQVDENGAPLWTPQRLRRQGYETPELDAQEAVAREYARDDVLLARYRRANPLKMVPQEAEAGTPPLADIQTEQAAS